MDTEHKGLNRRGFLKRGLGTTAGLVAATALGGEAQAAPAKAIANTGSIPTRPFGKLGFDVPVLGHGGSALIERDQDYYGIKVPSFDARVAMVRRAYEQGVRYFDTARIYAESEKIFGEALRDVRDEVFIATKPWTAEASDARAEVEKSLTDLGLDKVDSMQIHGPHIEKKGYDGIMPLYEELEKMREEGLYDYIGLTGHSKFEEMYKMIDTGNFDTVLIEFGYLRKGLKTRHSYAMAEWRELCVARAAELNMGVVAMKVLGAFVFGHNAPNVVPGYDTEQIAKLPGAAMRWVLNDQRVHVLNIGVSLNGDLDKNLAIMKEDLTLTNHDRMILADFAEKAYATQRIQDMKIV
jgi:predicted aldo/keto reductase-like oxidoreductase